MPEQPPITRIAVTQIDKIERDVYVTLRDHFEAILKEQNRAIEQATAEREKAASIMREGLIHQVKSGDDALERHIMEQVAQLRGLISGQAALINQSFDASQQAIAKAEEATEKRLELLNEFRGQQADESKKYALRESIESSEKTMNARMSKIENLMSKMVGGILVVGAIGLANLVKLWFMGHP